MGLTLAGFLNPWPWPLHVRFEANRLSIIDEIRRSSFRHMTSFRLPYPSQLFFESLGNSPSASLAFQFWKRFRLCLRFCGFSPFKDTPSRPFRRRTFAGRCPRDCTPSQAMQCAPNTLAPGRDQAMVLEKVEMPPNVFFEITGFASCSAFRTRGKRFSLGLGHKMQLIRLLRKVQRLTNDFSGGGQFKAQHQKIASDHNGLPVSWRSLATVHQVVQSTRLNFTVFVEELPKKGN